MKCKLLKGENQIGGCVVEVESNQGTKIVIDIGEDLPSQNKIKVDEEFEIEGLTKGKARYEAVFVTHYHGDHIGLFNKVLQEIPIYIGEVSKEIYKQVNEQLLKAKKKTKEDLEKIDKLKTYKIPNKVQIKDITITPIEVDHSAFNSHMLLIECDGKKLLHTGDFRTHGQRGKSVLKALEKYVGKVDGLICEGTTLSRKKQLPITEMEIQDKAEQIFKENKYTFVMCSSTNIDRISAIHKGALQANRLFICDRYQKKILMYIDSISRSGLYKYENKVKSYGKNLLPLMENMGFVMLVRPNYLSKEIMKKFPNSQFIYSEWEGYLDEKFTEYKYMQEFVPENYIYLHTSGHADYETIKTVCNLVEPKIIIPIHTEKAEVFYNMEIKNCQIKLIKKEQEVYIV